MSIAIQMLTFGNYVVKPFFLDCDVPEEIIKMASVTGMGEFVCVHSFVMCVVFLYIEVQYIRTYLCYKFCINFLK